MNERKEQREMTEMQMLLALEQAIDRNLGELVNAAARTVLLLQDDLAMRESQIRNVLNVAMSTQSLEVVTNFIRYQMGRSGGNRAWLHRDFGKKVVEDIETPQGLVMQLLAKVTDQAWSKVQQTKREDVKNEARLRLVRLYLGYLNRWFYYGSKTRNWDDIKGVTEEGAAHV